MRDITTMHTEAIAQKSGKFGMIQTLPALSWGAPYHLQLCETFIQHPSACQTPPAVLFQMGNSSGHSSIVTCLSAVPFEYNVGLGQMQNSTFHYTHCHSFDHCLIFVVHSRCARLRPRVKNDNVSIQRNDINRWSSTSLQLRCLSVNSTQTHHMEYFLKLHITIKSSTDSALLQVLLPE